MIPTLPVVRARLCIAVAALTAGGIVRAGEPADRSFIARAASIHEGQRDLARLSERKSGDARVRRLAERIDREHQAALVRLRALGVEHDFFLPDRLQDPEVRRFKRLDSVEGVAFDRVFATTVAAGEDDAVRAFAAEAADGKSAALRAYAAATLPMLRAGERDALALERALE